MRTLKKTLYLFTLLFVIGFLSFGLKQNVYAKDTKALQIYPKNMNKKSKKKVGKYYFWGDSKSNLYFSKYKSGKKKTRISKKVTSAVTNGKYVYFTKNNAGGKLYRYQLSKKKTKSNTVKEIKALRNINLLNIYGNNLYFCADQDDGDGIIFPFYKYNFKTKKLKRLSSISEDASTSMTGSTNGRYFLFVVYSTDNSDPEDPSFYKHTHLFDCKTGKIIPCKDRGVGFFYDGKLYMAVSDGYSYQINSYKLPSQKSTLVKKVKGFMDPFTPILNNCIYYGDSENGCYKFNLKTKKESKTSEAAMDKAW